MNMNYLDFLESADKGLSWFFEALGKAGIIVIGFLVLVFFYLVIRKIRE